MCWEGLQIYKTELDFSVCLLLMVCMTLGKSFHFSETQVPQLQNGSIMTFAYNMPTMIFSAEVEHRFMGDY